jgi:hypothetical protein
MFAQNIDPSLRIRHPSSSCRPLTAAAVEIVLRLAAPDVIGQVEHFEMPADDLLGAESLDPLRSGVPAHDPPLRIEHDDRVIGDALDHQPEALLGPAELLFRVPARAVVSADQQVADDSGGRVAESGDRDHRGKAAAVLPDVGQLVDVLDAARCLEGERLEAGGDRGVELEAQRGGARDHFLGIGDVGRRDPVDDFRRFIAEHPLGADVEQLDDALLVRGDAREVRAAEDRVLEGSGLEQSFPAAGLDHSSGSSGTSCGGPRKDPGELMSSLFQSGEVSHGAHADACAVADATSDSRIPKGGTSHNVAPVL